jgi:hypothetical protein
MDYWCTNKEQQDHKRKALRQNTNQNAALGREEETSPQHDRLARSSRSR